MPGTEKFSSTNKCNKHNIAKHFKQKGKCIPECWALRIRWLWANKIDPSRPWAGLPIQVPNLVKSVHKQTAKRRTVAQALLNRKWVEDIKGALTVKVLVE